MSRDSVAGELLRASLQDGDWCKHAPVKIRICVGEIVGVNIEVM